jgi:competence protein ComGC
VFEAVQTKGFTGSIIEMVLVKYIFHLLLLVAQKNDHG